jgi:hypothetical protein
MAYLNNTTLEIDAVLTKKGRQLLSKDPTKFIITQFALADDEVDYNMWNPNHTLGSDYYGEMIEKMPITEANPNENLVMKYKLISLDKSTTKMPILDIGQTNITLKAAGQIYTITPSTLNITDGDLTYGYTAILSDSDVCILTPTPGYTVNIDGVPTTNITSEEQQLLSNESVTVVAKRFDITAKSQPYNDTSATITIIGNETGGWQVLNVLVLQNV